MPRTGDKILVTVEHFHNDWAIVRYKEQTSVLMPTEITWEVTSRPFRIEDYLSIGDVVEVLVTRADEERFSVSLKAMHSNPWDNAPAVDDKYTGLIRTPTDYGWFVLLTRYFEGLLLKEDASVDYQVGDSIEVQIKSCDAIRHRIYLREAS